MPMTMPRAWKTGVAMGAMLLCVSAMSGQKKKDEPPPRHAPAHPAAHSAPHPAHKAVHHAAPARHTMKNGNSVERHRNGRVANVHDEARHMDVHHGLSGDRRVSVERADHSRLVAERGRPGYIERPYGYRGHEYIQRSYYWHGHAYNRFYRSYFYHGVGLHVYVPVHYYSVGFYGWVYHPWRTRVVYAWGWGGSPWYGYYGGYFAPYPAYTRPSAWLTDYLISSDLQAAYEAGRAAGAPPPPDSVVADAATPELTPEVKDLIDNEVQTEIMVENGEAALNAADQEADPASSGIARTLADGSSHVFVVGAALDVTNEDTDDECSLTEGDVLQTTVPPGPDDQTASLVVLASKGGSECAKSATVTVPLDALQEMQNQMRETIDRGMDELQNKQGTQGIPAAPPAAVGAPAPAAFAALAPPPDPNGAAELDQQQKAADAVEGEVTAQEGSDTQSTPAPIERRPPS